MAGSRLEGMSMTVEPDQRVHGDTIAADLLDKIGEDTETGDNPQMG